METDKETATRRPRRLRHIGRFLPYLKAAAALLLLSHSSFYFPVSPTNPSDFLRRAAAVLIRPGFVFLIGNAIILLLFAKSGQNPSSSESNSFPESHPPPPPPSLEPMEEIVCDDKGFGEEICGLNRSRSEKFERIREEGKLRRAETSVSRRSRKGITAQDRRDSEGEDDGEQFRRTIEEFIAKQQRFQREECSPVINSPPE